MFKKVCRWCGKEFDAKYHNQNYCGGEHYAKCCICGKQILINNTSLRNLIDSKDIQTCSKECAHARRVQLNIEKFGVENVSQLQSTKDKIKENSLKKYGTAHPRQSKEVSDKIKSTCLERYGTTCSMNSEDVRSQVKQRMLETYGVEFYQQTDEFKERYKKTSLEHYGVENPNQSEEIKQKKIQTSLNHYGVSNPNKSPEVIQKIKDTKQQRYNDSNYCNVDKIKQTSMQHYGVSFPMQSKEVQDKAIATNLQNLGVKYPMQSEEVRKKSVQTCIETYGVTNPAQSDRSKQTFVETCNKRYGVDNPSQFEPFKLKATVNARYSKLEERICQLFHNYNIEYVTHYFLSNDKCSHEFDFYLPKYKLLIDADGVYFHSYISDPDGKHVLDKYDEVRLHLVPEDHMFYVIVEGNEDKDVKKICEILKQIDENIFDYDSYLFNWCRSISFPYPEYSNKRLLSDYNSLYKYQNSKYNSDCRLGESIIKQYHKSIYSAHVGNYLSPIAAWNDDELLKKVIKNRLIYKNNVDPSKILAGFNISKICPRVSIFNPVLAKYLVQKYLSDFDYVFDPFSGFSGRLLGVCASGKSYIGQDFNSDAVAESSQIVSEFNLNATVKTKDILESHGTYDCLLTCPPYSDKETYNAETHFKTCDDWITECLDRFDCKTYVFVVDETTLYADNIAEELKTKSHFVNFSEKVVVIHRD